jgi:hypothetical protein
MGVQIGLEPGLPTSGTRAAAAWRGRPESVTRRRAWCVYIELAGRQPGSGGTRSDEMSGPRESPKRAGYERLAARRIGMGYEVQIGQVWAPVG